MTPTIMLSSKELDLLHQGVLDVLEKTGMQIMVPEFLCALEHKGAKVDHQKQVVLFPPKLIEETLETVRKQRDNVVRMPFSWHDTFTLGNRPAAVEASFGGACIYIYDYENQTIRNANSDDMVRMLQLGDMIPEVKSVGNPVMCLWDSHGKRVHEKLVALRGASLIAKNCRKPATAQVLTVEDLELIIEMGIVLKGSWEEYKKEPFLMSVKEPTSPLRLTDSAGNVLAAMAKKELPCYIVPMPLMGLSAPVTPASSIIISTAEILGIWTAILSLSPQAPVQAQVVSGVIDVRTGRACFAAPEAILIDLGVASLFRDKYGLKCDTGTSWIDAKYPGVQASLERNLKLSLSALGGSINYPTGALCGNTVFSPEQAMIDIDNSKALNRFLDGMEVNAETMCMELIHEMGIGGSFFGTDHTAENFRQNVWIPELFNRSAATLGKITSEKDIVAEAHHKWRELLKTNDPYVLDSYKSKEIDRIVKKGEELLLK
jgi:trimethylamine--corrinoid protein Co-methyltransferase